MAVASRDCLVEPPPPALRGNGACTGPCRTVLGASNLTYAEPVLHQDLPTWIGAHVNALAYWGGVPAALVPDNPKVGVTRPDYYAPTSTRPTPSSRSTTAP